MNFGRTLFLCALLLFSSTLFSQSNDEMEPLARLEIGAAPAWSLTDHTSSLGPSVSVEFTPIRNWLEIEVGTAPSFSAHSTEWDTEILFKKPWDITPKIELMAGIGPAWINTSVQGVRANSLAGTAALDFMFWTTRAHNIGWFCEPSYEHSFQSGHDKSLGFGIGLLIGIRGHQN